MVMDSKIVKVYETEAFSQLTHGARLFRYSSKADNSASSLEKQNETAKEAAGTSSSVTEPTELNNIDFTTLSAIRNKIHATETEEIPSERNNFIDRRIGPSERTDSRRNELANLIGKLENIMNSTTEQENAASLRLGQTAARGEGGCEKKAERVARSCLTCGEEFPDAVAQRRHYQLDWHRCNLHRALKGRLPVSEEQFAELVDAEEVSSISGSETESESEDDSSPEATANEGEAGVGPESQRHTRVFFESADHRVFSLHRCLLHSKKETATEEQLLSACVALGGNARWAVILAGGGHFAAAIFDGGVVTLRKTFHTYTVRRGQGTAQGLRDSRGNAPKSAGAALRRRNELTLLQDVQALLDSWRDQLSSVSLVFVRASPTLKASLFGGRRPSIGPRDPRLRPLPFPTRRATLAECQRAHDVLATVTKHGSTQVYQQLLRAEAAAVCVKPPTPRAGNRDASRELRDQPQPALPSAPSSDEDLDAGPELQTELMQLDFGSLREFQCKPRHKRKPRRGRRAGGKPAQGSEPAQAPVQEETAATETARPWQGDAEHDENAEPKEGNEAGRTEHRAAARRLRRERLRQRHAEEDLQRQEEEERQRFQQLSDREKRALAAERRFATAGASTPLSRCHLCGIDMTGQVPFCYLDLRFCSVRCLQSHRRSNT